MELTASERIMMAGLLAREREIERETLAPFRADLALVTRMIESRLNLTAGAIGTTYSIDMGSMSVVDTTPQVANPVVPADDDATTPDTE